jgi:gliding motility-associated lipoprotein GldH
MRKIIHLPIILLIVATIASCSDNVVIEAYKDISDARWHVDSLVAFEFEIRDTLSWYDINYNVRYAGDYDYFNLYVTYYIEDSTGNIIESELQNLILFDKKTGEPLGKGLGDLYDRDIPIFEKYRFKRAGKHTFKIKQFMRMEELPGVMAFGIKIIDSSPK